MALVCTVTLDKTGGISAKVENAEGKITQTVVMNGTVITLTVAGESDTTTITQGAKSVTTECKGPGESKTTVTQTETSLTFECQGAASTSKIVQKADSITMQCDTFVVEAARAATVTASESSLLKLSGGLAKMSSDGQLEVSSNGIGTFKANITNVQGSLVNVG